MAVRRQVGNLADMLLKNYMGRKTLEYQSGLVGERQRELAAQNDKSTMLSKILGDPSGRMAAAARKAGQQFEGVDLDMLVPDAQNTVATKLAGTSKLEELPMDDPSMDALLHSQPGYAPHAEGEDRTPIETLMAQAASRRDSIIASMTPQQVNGYDAAAGNKTTTFMNPFDAALKGPIQTEPTGQQAGVQKGNSDVAELGISGPAKAKQAGAEASAQAYGRLNAEFDPRIVAKRLDEKKQEAVIAAASAGNKAAAESAIQRAGAMTAALPQLTRMRKLGQEISEVYPPDTLRDLAHGMVGMMGATPIFGPMMRNGYEAGIGGDAAARTGNPEMITKVNDFLRLRGATAMMLVNTVFANKGLTSENDRRAAEEILGSPLFNSEQWKRNDAFLTELLETAVATPFSKPDALAEWYAAKKPDAAPAAADPNDPTAGARERLRQALGQ